MINFYYLSPGQDSRFQEVLPFIGIPRLGIPLGVNGNGNWIFALAIYPNWGINEIGDWVEELTAWGASITDDKGNKITFDDFVGRVFSEDVKDKSKLVSLSSHRSPFDIGPKSAFSDLITKSENGYDLYKPPVLI